MFNDVLTSLSNMKINVTEMNARDAEDGHFDLYLTISVYDREQLEFVLGRLMRISGVSEVKRIKAGS